MSENVVYLTAEELFSIGQSYENGIEGHSQSYEEAALYYGKAAEMNHPLAQNSYGDLFYYGQGVKQSYTEAIKWYKLAAEQGNVRSQFNLGNKYYYGENVEQSYEEAVKWYTLAAEQGSVSTI